LKYGAASAIDLATWLSWGAPGDDFDAEAGEPQQDDVGTAAIPHADGG
jgi:hypothetical protein